MDESTLQGEFILNGNNAEPETLPEKSSTQNPVTNSSSNILAQNPPHFYSSFSPNPIGLSFQDQEANEQILLLLRRHFITNVPWITATLLLIILPVIFPFFLHNFPFPLPSQHTLLLLLASYYLFIFGFILINFTLWYFQAGLVTNIRVIDVDLSGILYRQISETGIHHIEDVSYKQAGFIRSLFNYGNVLVQTAGAEENIEYDRVPRPSKVAEIIGDLSQGA